MERSERVAIAFDAALRKRSQACGRTIGNVSPIVLRLAAVLLFLWYLVEFTIVLFRWGHWVLGPLLAVTVVALAALFVAACWKTKGEYDHPNPQVPAPASPVKRYFYAVLLPVAAVFISAFWRLQYPTPLLRFTQRIFEVLSL